jgi:hypothetical protein
MQQAGGTSAQFGWKASAVSAGTTRSHPNQSPNTCQATPLLEVQVRVLSSGL